MGWVPTTNDQSAGQYTVNKSVLVDLHPDNNVTTPYSSNANFAAYCYPCDYGVYAMYPFRYQPYDFFALKPLREIGAYYQLNPLHSKWDYHQDTDWNLFNTGAPTVTNVPVGLGAASFETVLVGTVPTLITTGIGTVTDIQVPQTMFSLTYGNNVPGGVANGGGSPQAITNAHYGPEDPVSVGGVPELNGLLTGGVYPGHQSWGWTPQWPNSTGIGAYGTTTQPVPPALGNAITRGLNDATPTLYKIFGGGVFTPDATAIRTDYSTWPQYREDKNMTLKKVFRVRSQRFFLKPGRKKIWSVRSALAHSNPMDDNLVYNSMATGLNIHGVFAGGFTLSNASMPQVGARGALGDFDDYVWPRYNVGSPGAWNAGYSIGGAITIPRYPNGSANASIPAVPPNSLMKRSAGDPTTTVPMAIGVTGVDVHSTVAGGYASSAAAEVTLTLKKVYVAKFRIRMRRHPGVMSNTLTRNNQDISHAFYINLPTGTGRMVVGPTNSTEPAPTTEFVGSYTSL